MNKQCGAKSFGKNVEALEILWVDEVWGSRKVEEKYGSIVALRLEQRVCLNCPFTWVAG